MHHAVIRAISDTCHTVLMDNNAIIAGRSRHHDAVACLRQDRLRGPLRLRV
jgi:hypothetical protein